MDMHKKACAEDLANLLVQWEALKVNKNATDRDIARMAAKVKAACAALDAFDIEGK